MPLRLPLLPLERHHRENGLTERKRNKNTYSNEDKAVALAVTSCLGCRRSQHVLSIPKQTINDWEHGRHINDEVIAMAKHFKERIEKSFEELIEKCLPLALSRSEDASYRDLMVGCAIAVDKLQLLRGEPTQIVEQNTATREEREARLRELLNLAAAREALPAPAAQPEADAEPTGDA